MVMRKLKLNPHHWPTRKIVASALWGVLLLALSLLINYLAGTYATSHASNPVNDIILDHIPALDVDGIFIDGFAMFFLLVAGLLVYWPKKIPFILKSYSLFILTRSFFIILTHLGPIPQQISLADHSTIMGLFTFTGDLFFSAHTGLPFLMALIFWDYRFWRWFFIFLSIFFGAVVLLGHLHYSIDVFSAYFITYGIFQIALRTFRRDYLLMSLSNAKQKKS